jgi:hypothetical protein
MRRGLRGGRKRSDEDWLSLSAMTENVHGQKLETARVGRFQLRHMSTMGQFCPRKPVTLRYIEGKIDLFPVKYYLSEISLHSF